jgi:predicted RecB family endonuclease
VSNELERNGFKVRAEAGIGEGKAVDIVGEKNGKRFAVEVETGHSDEVKNVRKDLSAGFDKVLVVPTSKAERERLLRKLYRLDSA